MSFLKVLSHLMKLSEEAFSGHSEFKIADPTAIGENPVRSITLDAVPLDGDQVMVTLSWQGGEKLFEKTMSSDEANHKFQLISTDLAQIVSLTSEEKYDEAKAAMKEVMKTYTEDTDSPVMTNLPKLHTTQAELDIDADLWKQAAQVKVQNVFPSGTIQNLTFESTQDLQEYMGKQKGNIPLWEQEGKGTPEDKSNLVAPSLSYEDVEKQKAEEHDDMSKHIDETIKKELESALQEKAASVFGPEQVELVKVLRRNGRNWDEIRKMLTKDFHFDKDAVTIFVDQQRQEAGDEGVEIKKEEPSPLKPPENLVSPETHEKLLEDLKKDKEPVEEEIEKVESARVCPACGEPHKSDIVREHCPDCVALPMSKVSPEELMGIPEVKESTKKDICPECDGEGSVPVVRGGRVIAIDCPSCGGDTHITQAPKELESAQEEIARADNSDIKKVADESSDEIKFERAVDRLDKRLMKEEIHQEEYDVEYAKLKKEIFPKESALNEKVAAESHEHTCPKCDEVWECHKGQACNEGKSALCGKHYAEKEFGKKESSLRAKIASYMRIPESDSIVKKALQLWQRASNYMGDDLSDYYVGPAKGYDAEALEKSNFKVALEMLGGEGNGVLVGSFGGFGGSFEQIFVQKDAADKVAILQDIENKLTDYPVLDDEDYSNTEMEEQQESYESWAKSEALKIIDEELHRQNPDLQGSVSELELSPESERKLQLSVMEDLSYGDGTGLHPKHLIEEADAKGLLTDLRNQLSGKEVIPENPAQMKLFESSLRKKLVKKALQKRALNPLQEPIETEPTLPTEDVVPFGKSENHLAPSAGDWVMVKSDLKDELPAFKAKFISEYSSNDGTKYATVETEAQDLLEVELHRVTKITDAKPAAQEAEPITEPIIEKPTEEKIQVTPKMDDFHSASLNKKANTCPSCGEDDEFGPIIHQDNCPHKREEREVEKVEDYREGLESSEKEAAMPPFGSVAWQEMMEKSIKEKNLKGLPLSESEQAFVESQAEHNKRLIDDQARTSSQDDLLTIKAEAEQLLNLVKKAETEGDVCSKCGKEVGLIEMSKWVRDGLCSACRGNNDKTAFCFPKNGLKKEARQTDSAFEGDGWVRVWVDQMDVELDPEYKNALAQPDEASKIAALKEIARKLAYNQLEEGKESAGMYASFNFDSLVPSEHDRIDWYALANPEPEDVESSLKQADEAAPKVHLCEQCGQDMGNEWLLGPVCGKCCRKNHKRVTGSEEKEAAALRPGDHVRVSEGSGLDSGRTGVVVDWREFQDEVGTNDRMVPNIPGHYKPVDWSRSVAIRYDDDHKLDTMFKNRLFPIDKIASDFEKGISQNKTADEPAVEPTKTQFKDYKITPKYTPKEEATPVNLELDQVLSKMDALEQNLGALDRAKKEIQAKLQEEMKKIDQAGERAQMEEELQASIEKASVLIQATASKVVQWRDKLLTVKNEEVQYVPKLTPKEMLEKIYKRFSGAEKFVQDVLNGLLSQAKQVTEKTLIRWPNKKSSLGKEANLLDDMNHYNEELLEALKLLSSPL